MVGDTVYSKPSMFSGYWQVWLADQVQEITAFICSYGVFQFFFMSFWLITAPVMFQRMAPKLFGDLHFVKVHIDDVVIYSNSTAEHILHSKIACERIRWAGLRFCKKKKWKQFYICYIPNKSNWMLVRSSVLPMRDYCSQRKSFGPF